MNMVQSFHSQSEYFLKKKLTANWLKVISHFFQSISLSWEWSLIFLKENGCGNIYDESGIEAIDIVDEKADSYDLKQLLLIHNLIGMLIFLPSERYQSKLMRSKIRH